MIYSIKSFIALLSTFVLSSVSHAELLLPDSKETPRMKQWMGLKYGMFIHFGMNTFTGKEHEPGQVPSTTYAPTNVDTDQWMRVAKEAGMRYAVLTAKHVSGHCLWDSKVNFKGKEYDYDVATSGNRTDVIQSFVDSCKKHEISPGLYYCLLDYRNNPDSTRKPPLSEEFFQLAKDQLTELATRYPDVNYFWMDIPAAASADQRAVLYDMLRRLKPEAVVMFNKGFLGKKQKNLNQQTTKGASWPTDILNSERDAIQEPFVTNQTWDGMPRFLGYEHCDVIGKKWFCVESDNEARPIEKLYDLYDSAVNKAGGNMVLNVGPDKNGKIVDWQIQALMDLKKRINEKK